MSKEAFLKSMKALLGTAYEGFERSLHEPAFRGVYVNRLKCSVSDFCRMFPYPLTPTPFSENGFYIEPSVQGLGNLALHHAGAFYAQEPSAMSAAAVLEAKPGDKVLDLCAAPGGKTVALAGALGGEGLLWSNEYVKQRAFTLLSNCERIGVRNIVISNAAPAALAAELSGYFDKVLIDAPCSGEGMLRREKAEYERWNEKNILICAARQSEILESGAKLVRTSGYLVYSTCTFNRAENEDVISAFLDRHPDFALVPIAQPFGSPGIGMPQAKRIFPSDGGEGHFVAKLQKIGESASAKVKYFTPVNPPKAFEDFCLEQFSAPPYGAAHFQNGRVCFIPTGMPRTESIHIVRAGVLAGEMQRERFVPAHQLYSAAQSDACRNRLTLSPEDVRTAKYLHGEEIEVLPNAAQKGYCAVTLGDIPLGFGKVSGGKLKNHYPKGLRNLS